ncbi:hypothetical protein V8G54_031080 [Vigna mungo]|uniref:GRF-type domain-containing protein n=1 Tax=Vigna mungo TaxID=3915 RepID=A0AAQ3MXY1_VIGMU
MSMQHSSPSCSCNECLKQFRCVSSRGDGGWSKNEASLSCDCGEKCVLRTAKTTKNRGRQFWGCPRYKLESETVGCNYFRWLADCSHDESVSCEVLEANDQRLVKSFENESDIKILGRKVEVKFVAMQKTVMGIERWTKILVHVSFLCVLIIIVIAMLLGRA